MPTFSDELVDQVRTGLCITTSTASATAALGSRIYGSVGFRGGQNASDQAANFWNNLASVACNRPIQDVQDAIDPDFTGGQCPDVLYDVTATLVRNGVPQSGWPRTDTRIGPISYTPFTRGDGGPAVSMTDGNGDEFFVSGSPPGDTLVLSPIDVQRTDGQPDDCGNQDAIVWPYDSNNFNYPTTVNYTDRDGNPQTQPVDITYAPTTINEDGDFIVPFEVNFGDNNISFGDFNVTTGDINIGGGNDNGDGIQPEPRELEEGEEPEDGTSIIGVRVTSTVVSLKAANLTELFSDDGGENLFVPRLGGVLFTLEGDSGPAETVFRDFKTLDSVIISPKPATSVRLFTRQGVSSVTRLLVVPNASLCCRN